LPPEKGRLPRDACRVPFGLQTVAKEIGLPRPHVHSGDEVDRKLVSFNAADALYTRARSRAHPHIRRHAHARGRYPDSCVYYGATAEQKLRIVQGYQAISRRGGCSPTWAQQGLVLQGRGCVVGFVGDGVNDVLAMAQADVGVLVGSKVGAPLNAAAIPLIVPLFLMRTSFPSRSWRLHKPHGLFVRRGVPALCGHYEYVSCE
jgi:hypothetical protein